MYGVRGTQNGEKAEETVETAWDNLRLCRNRQMGKFCEGV